MRLVVTALLALAPGCGALGLDDAGTDSLDGTLSIRGLDPTSGPAGHQTPVVIDGSGFVGTVEVWFGDELVPVTVVDEETLLAVSPAGEPGTVDVRVRSGLGDVTQADAYTFTAGDTGEPPDDTGEPPDDTGEPPDSGDSGGGDSGETGDTGEDRSGEGLVGGLLELRLVQIACPDCLGYASNLEVFADGAFHRPTAAGWFDWLPRAGSCADNPAQTAPASSFLDAGEWAYLTTGSVSIGMRQSGGIYAADGLDQSEFVRTASYDLSLPTGGADLDAFSVTGVMYTPQAISTITPVEMLYTQPNQAFAARIRASDATVEWGPSGGSDPFLVVLDVYDPRGTFVHEVVCLGDDDGSLTIPAGMLAGDAQNSLLVIGMYRYALGGFERPDNASTVETVASFGVIGTGILVP